MLNCRTFRCLSVGRIVITGVSSWKFSKSIIWRTCLGQTLITIEYNKVKWVVKFVPKWNLATHPPTPYYKARQSKPICKFRIMAQNVKLSFKGFLVNVKKFTYNFTFHQIFKGNTQRKTSWIPFISSWVTYATWHVFFMNLIC